MEAAPESFQERVLHSFVSFGGVPAGQILVDYWLWEFVLNSNPGLRAVAEIGTWQGGFSRYLHAQTVERGMRFATWDAVVPEKPPPGFRHRDVFANPEPITRFLENWSLAILLCDGGNKPREMQTFAPRMPSGSLLIVHDWLTEVQPEEVPPVLEPIYENVCDELGSMSRVFRVT